MERKYRELVDVLVKLHCGSVLSVAVRCNHNMATAFLTERRRRLGDLTLQRQKVEAPNSSVLRQMEKLQKRNMMFYDFMSLLRH